MTNGMKENKVEAFLPASNPGIWLGHCSTEGHNSWPSSHEKIQLIMASLSWHVFKSFFSFKEPEASPA